MKKLLSALFLFLCFIILSSISTPAQTKCETSSDAVLFNDSTRLSLRVIQKPIVQNDSSCNRFLVSFNTSKKKFQDVYDLRFYHDSSSETKLKVSFLVNDTWSEETVFKVAGKGYRTHAISILGASNDAESLSVKKMKIELVSLTEVLVDEMEFRYFDTPEEPVKGLTKERKKEITKQVEELSKKEQRAVKRELLRKNKELYGTDGQGGN